VHLISRYTSDDLRSALTDGVDRLERWPSAGGLTNVRTEIHLRHDNLGILT